jgi:hypothetical protein
MTTSSSAASGQWIHISVSCNEGFYCKIGMWSSFFGDGQPPKTEIYVGSDNSANTHFSLNGATNAKIFFNYNPDGYATFHRIDQRIRNFYIINNLVDPLSKSIFLDKKSRTLGAYYLTDRIAGLKASTIITSSTFLISSSMVQMLGTVAIRTKCTHSVSIWRWNLRRLLRDARQMGLIHSYKQRVQ